MRKTYMKKWELLVAVGVIVVAFPVDSLAQKESFSIPHLPFSEVSEEGDTRVVLTTNKSHEEAVSFYKEFVKDLDNIKILDRDDYVQIVDHGSLSWHSITIDKEPSGGTLNVTIVQDSWSWILGTLVLRFIGVFVVLLVLFVGMMISGKILPLFAKSIDKKKEDAIQRPNVVTNRPNVVTDTDQELVAVAIAAATHFRNRQQGAV